MLFITMKKKKQNMNIINNGTMLIVISWVCPILT